MKKILVITLSVMLLSTVVYGAIVTTEGEQKIGQAIKQIYSQVDSCRNSIGVIYAKAKLYITDHPTQFTTDDKMKLTGLQVEITATDTAIASLKTYIETNFSGLNE